MKRSRMATIAASVLLLLVLAVAFSVSAVANVSAATPTPAMRAYLPLVLKNWKFAPTATPTSTPTFAPTSTPTSMTTNTPTVMMTSTATSTITPTPTINPSCVLEAYAFEDKNGDWWRQGNEEPLLAGAIFHLHYYGGNGPGPLIGTGVTNSEAPVTFTVQPYVRYYLEEINPPMYCSTSPDKWGVYFDGGPSRGSIPFGDIPCWGPTLSMEITEIPFIIFTSEGVSVTTSTTWSCVGSPCRYDWDCCPSAPVCGPGGKCAQIVYRRYYLPIIFKGYPPSPSPPNPCPGCPE